MINNSIFVHLSDLFQPFIYFMQNTALKMTRREHDANDLTEMTENESHTTLRTTTSLLLLFM